MTDNLKDIIRIVPDFPKPGIRFIDIMPLVQDSSRYHEAVDRIASWAERLNPDRIIGIESRGYLFAAPLANRLHLGLSVIRKKGKLPYKTISLKAPNEYAVEYFEMHIDSLMPGERIVVIDDLIATGSSSICAVNLVQSLKGKVVGFGALVDLGFLNGLRAVQEAHQEIEVMSLMTFNE